MEFRDNTLKDTCDVVTSCSLTTESKLDIMRRAVGTCPRADIKICGKDLSSLLDSGSEVSLVRESHFRKNVLPFLKEGQTPTGVHSLFRLRGMGENSNIPVTDYFEVDVNFNDFTIPSVGFLVIKDPSTVVSTAKPMGLPGVVGSNMLRLGVEEFVRLHSVQPLVNFDRPLSVHPLVFAELCMYYHAKVMETQECDKQQGSQNFRGVSAETSSNSATLQNNSVFEQSVSELKKNVQKTSREGKNKGLDESGFLGQVMVGSRHQPICIPANSSKVLVGRADKTAVSKDCLMEVAMCSNLPSGVVVNRDYVHPGRSKQVPVILMNTNGYNVWIRQPLLAAELYDATIVPWDHEIVMSREEGSDEIKIGVQAVPDESVRAEILAAQSEQEPEGGKGSEELPAFGARPDTSSPDFDFKSELERLPFKLNLGEVSLSREQEAKFIDIIYDYQSVFSLHDSDLGYCDRIKHTIPTTTDRPVYLPHRTIPVQLQSEVRKCLDTWLRQGIIRPSRSPYASQVVIVRKKSGEIRLCVDFRKLNAQSIRDSFPLPRVEEALQAVQSAVWFTCFDLAQGYLQLAMEDADIQKTAFRAGSSGLFEFTRMPFGLSNAGASFCRLMEMCIGDQQYVTLLFYLDDICVFSTTIDQMLNRIELVFRRLKEFNLKIKPKKSHFFQRSATFLGHVLSSQGIAPNPEKVDKVRDWPVPGNAKEVHSFVGLASYYRRFIPNFAKIAAPLHAVIAPIATKRKGSKVTTDNSNKRTAPAVELPFCWTEECQEAFQTLKDALISAPVLAYPDYTKPFILETDASLQGLGAVLSQVTDSGEVKPIAYASRSLRPSERSMRDYSSAKLELMALKWAICDKFKDYLLGSKFTVYTDNNPLVYVKTSKLGAAQIRWLSELALFDFDIVYRTGRTNRVADALSRRPTMDEEENESDTDSDEWETISYGALCQLFDDYLDSTKIPRNVKAPVQTESERLEEGGVIPNVEASVGATAVFNQVTPESMAEHQKADGQIAPAYFAVEQDKKPSSSKIHRVRSKASRKLLLQFDRLEIKKGVLHRTYVCDEIEYHQLVLPQQFRQRVLKSTHDDFGHQSLDRTLQLLRERFYWPGMANEAEHWVKRCQRCNTSKGDYTGPYTKQGSLVANNPLDLLCVDFTKVDPSKSGKENVLVITDAFSKFSQAFVTPNQKAITVAKVLVEKWFLVYGIPSRLHSDKGRSFENEIIRNLCSMYGIHQTTTTPYNPRGNSQCERFNRTLFGLLKTLSKEQKSDWPQYLPALVFAYNATPHGVTKFQPYELMFGRKAPVPCDHWLGLSQYNDLKSSNKVVWLDNQLEQITFANRKALKNIKEQAKKSADRIGGSDLNIPVGGLVLLRDHPEGRNKIQDNYKSELYVVRSHHKDPNVYYITPVSGGGLRKVNRRQLFDLKTSRTEEIGNEVSQEDFLIPGPCGLMPRKRPSGNKTDLTTSVHPYNTRSRSKVSVSAVQTDMDQLEVTRL